MQTALFMGRTWTFDGGSTSRLARKRPLVPEFADDASSPQLLPHFHRGGVRGRNRASGDAARGSGEPVREDRAGGRGREARPVRAAGRRPGGPHYHRGEALLPGHEERADGGALARGGRGAPLGEAADRRSDGDVAGRSPVRSQDQGAAGADRSSRGRGADPALPQGPQAAEEGGTGGPRGGDGRSGGGAQGFRLSAGVRSGGDRRGRSARVVWGAARHPLKMLRA